MTSQNINREELQDVLTQLEQALYNHQVWHNDITRTIACHLQANNQDIVEGAHKDCKFGQWYYSDLAHKLHNHPGYQAIGDAHQHMHGLAAKILQSAATHNQVTVLEYDRFSNAVESLQLEIQTLKRELETSLYSRDPLTGVINRVDMMPVLRELHEMTKRNAMVASIVMLDLDKFKVVNDTYGHPAGDKVLFTVSQYLMANIRVYDKIFRFGGEEFLICMLQTDIDACKARTEQLRAGVADLLIEIGQEKPVKITASFGITLFEKDISIEANLERVDQAMYWAKKSGRNCVKPWASDLNH